MIARRDALFSRLLMSRKFQMTGQLPRFHRCPDSSEWLEDRVKRSVQPGVWFSGVAADGKNAVAVRPLTTSLRSAPAHIYLIAIHKDYYYHDRLPRQLNGILSIYEGVLSKYIITHVNKLIAPTGRPPLQLLYMYTRLDAYPTALSGINEALVEVRDEYNTWLISNSVPDPSLSWLWVDVEKIFVEYEDGVVEEYGVK
jgi:hypothetical protein